MRVCLRGRANLALFWGALIVIALSSAGPVIEAQAPAKRWDGLIELVAGRNEGFPPSVNPPIPADGASDMSRHGVSGDGRYVVFTATAPALAGYYGPALYLRDRRLSDTRVLFAGADPAGLRDAVISEDGRYVAFTVCEPWMRPDSAPICDVWAVDTLTGSRAPLSVASQTGEFGNANSDEPVLSRSGRFVVFRTAATNLAPGVPAGVPQIVIKDRDPDQNGIFDEPSPNTFQIVSAPKGAAGTVPGNGPSATAEVSENGRYVAFRSAATNLVPGDTNGVWDVFRRDRMARDTRRLNVRPSPASQSPNPIDSPGISMTPDGRYVAFASADPLLAPATIDDTNSVRDVFVFDAQSLSLQRVDVGWLSSAHTVLVPGNGPTDWPTLSADGRYVAVQSAAMNVENPPPPNSTHSYVVDRFMNTVTRVSVKPDGTDPDHSCVQPQISGDGSLVAFVSQAFNLTPNAFIDADRVYAAVHFEITPEEQSVSGGAGGAAAYDVVTQQHTPWWIDASEWQPWTDLETPPMGFGSGMLKIRANQANPSPTPRTATIKIFEKTARFTQLEGLSLIAISPVTGPDIGGTQVTFTGTGFAPGMRVVFDGLDAIAIEYVSSTTLVATTPAHGPGTAYVAVMGAVPDNSVALLDQAFRYTDSTPPQVWYGFSDTPNENGWFRTIVTLGWGWWDPETPVTSTAGCDPTVIATDTPGTTYTCTVTSGGGTSSRSAFAKRDATAPTATITSPRFQIYELGEVVQPAFTCSDAVSGVAACQGSTNGDPIDTSTPGYKTFGVSITDRAGNPGFVSVDYAVGSGVCAFPLPDMVSWWRMEGNTSNTRTGSATDATRVGLTSDVFVDAVVGQGYQFEGVDGYLQTNYAPTVLDDKKLALAAWVKPSADTLGTIMRARDLVGVARLANGNIAWAFRKINVPGLSYRDTGVTLPLGQWNHVVVMLDGTAVRTYLNGRLVHTEPNGADIDSPSGGTVTIGGAEDTGDYFKGVLDELQIFQHGLSDAEIEQLFLAGNAGACVPRGNPVITWPAPAPITYGVPVNGTQLNATANVAGTFSYSPPSGTLLPAGEGTLSVTFTPTDTASYNTVTATNPITVDKATPTVAVAGGVYTYDGQPHLATGSVTGVGGAQLTGLAFTYNGSSEPPVDAGAYTVTATYPGDANYQSVTQTTAIEIGPATPTVTVTGGTFTYDGRPHGASVIVAGVGGVELAGALFTYNGSADVPINAGTYTAVATFDGSGNYGHATGSAVVTILKATVVLGWNRPAPVVYGTALGSDELNATADAFGVFDYTPPAGTVLNAGTSQVLTATFSPADPANYIGGTVNTTIDVSKATATVTAIGGTFTYDGQPHPATGSVTGLYNATIGTPSFTYNGSSQPPVAAGSYAVVASFAGNANYAPASASATIVIGKASVVLSWNQPAAIVYGTQLGAVQLNASSSVPGTFAYSPAAGTVMAAGSGHALTATFTPADATNYTGGSVSTTIAVSAAPLAIRANDSAKAFGAPLPLFTPSAAGFVTGDSFASLSGALGFATSATAQSAVGTYPVVPSGLSSPNYVITFVPGTLTVVRGDVTVSVSTSPAPSGLNEPMTFTATVGAAAPAAGTPSGTVRFFDGPTLVGSSTLSGSSVSLTTAGLAAGVHTIEARYDGDASFATGSGSVSHTVNGAAATPSITIASNRNPASVGQSVTLTANLSMAAGPVSGAVQFYDGAALLGTSTIVSGSATFTTTAFAAGSHAITVRYLGSASAPPVISGVFVQAVGPPGWKNRTSSTMLTASPNPSAIGAAVTLTATVTGSNGTPAGAVVFMVNGEVVGGPVTLTTISGSTAQATWVLPGLAGGRHIVTATYLGSSNYKGSTAAVTQTVN